MPRAPQAPKEGSGDGVFMRLMALPKGRGMLTRALRVLYAPPSLAETVPGDPSWSLLTTCSCSVCSLTISAALLVHADCARVG